MSIKYIFTSSYVLQLR